MPERSWWGWGTDAGALSDDEVQGIAEVLRRRFGVEARRRRPPAVADLDLPAPRVSPPRSLAEITSMGAADRAGHAMGKAFRDVVRALQGRLEHPPDAVLRPRSEEEVAAALDWCASNQVAAIPYGGGSSVVGGVEPDVGDGYAGAVSLDLGALDRVLEVDPASQAARVQAGVLGPSLEAQLRPAGLTLRHFPQSFEFSSLGGWVATRAGGHFATGPTHIDDLVEGLRVVTPTGTLETRRLPASGAGPAPDRLFLGSEGILGVITEVWLRLRPRPRFRAGGACRFPDFLTGATAVRALAQSGLMPSNCRLVDPAEAQVNGIGNGTEAVLLVGFESADHPVGAWAARAEELVQDHGGTPDVPWSGPEAGTPQDKGAPGPSDAGAAWRDAFLRAPYVRDVLVQLGMVCETFETAVTWDRFEALHATVTSAVHEALEEVGAGSGTVTCRFTHVYSDGVAPYFTVVTPGRAGAELEQWDTVKAAAQEAVLAAGGTVTHHHAVGRVHRPWYDRERPALFGSVLQAAKATLDPAWVCNPGVLVDRP